MVVRVRPEAIVAAVPAEEIGVAGQKGNQLGVISAIPTEIAAIATRVILFLITSVMHSMPTECLVVLPCVVRAVCVETVDVAVQKGSPPDVPRVIPTETAILAAPVMPYIQGSVVHALRHVVQGINWNRVLALHVVAANTKPRTHSPVRAAQLIRHHVVRGTSKVSALRLLTLVNFALLANTKVLTTLLGAVVARVQLGPSPTQEQIQVHHHARHVHQDNIPLPPMLSPAPIAPLDSSPILDQTRELQHAHRVQEGNIRLSQTLPRAPTVTRERTTTIMLEPNKVIVTLAPPDPSPTPASRRGL